MKQKNNNNEEPELLVDMFRTLAKILKKQNYNKQILENGQKLKLVATDA